MSEAQRLVPAKRRTINPALKFALEFGPLAVFFITLWRLDIFWATGVLMASLVVVLIVSYALLGRIPIMPLVTAVIALIFGSLTLYLHDETFIKMKPTVLYLLFGGSLLSGLALNRPLLPILFDGALRLTAEGWRMLSWRWAFLFFAQALLNEIVWRTQTTVFWGGYKTFGAIPLTILFALSQAPLIMRHEAKGDEADDSF